MPKAQTSERAPVTRPVTEEEAAFYEANGWVKLDRFFEPELAAQLLRAAERELLGGENSAARLALHAANPIFRSVALHPDTGRNVRRLMNRRRLTDHDIAVRYRTDVLVRRDPGGDGVAFHQDTTQTGADRVGELVVWVALADVTPEMGAMRFLSGAHREGPLGNAFAAAAAGEPNLLDRYPKLADLYPMSGPVHYRAGDATVHHGYMPHGSPPNTTDRPRWSWVLSYMPADARYIDGFINGEISNLRERSCELRLPDERHHPALC